VKVGYLLVLQGLAESKAHYQIQSQQMMEKQMCSIKSTATSRRSGAGNRYRRSRRHRRLVISRNGSGLVFLPTLCRHHVSFLLSTRTGVAQATCVTEFLPATGALPPFRTRCYLATTASENTKRAIVGATWQDVLMCSGAHSVPWRRHNVSTTGRRRYTGLEGLEGWFGTVVLRTRCSLIVT
jgi:hypothetical protein